MTPTASAYSSDSFSPLLDEPLLFHPLKHHLSYIKSFIKTSSTTPNNKVVQALRTIGSSQLDLYVGQLTLPQLSQELLLHLRQQNLLTAAAFYRYLTKHGTDYYTVTLSDTSTWILRWGNVTDRYVHLHPGRYATNTVRVKANNLKTAIAVAIANRQTGTPAINLHLINQVRKDWLALPPLKTLTAEDGSLKLLALLTTDH
ncbi:hypothetical protein [Pontibacter harenae]|uniref:hypothetical protein n=1 Tax=Pontibacter harenae TaxID=2894083 RepID=UPI001E6503E0|nr:hypothetical protein [Pontibacter harenae]MCC9168037.1 hypothetical protein [Pontibacter harenae]